MRRSRTKAALALVANLPEYCSALLFAALIADVALGVFYRYVLLEALPWYEEAARYLFIWISFIGASIAVKRQAHFGLDALVIYLGRRARRWLSFTVGLFVILFALLMVVEGTRMALFTRDQLSTAMGISMAWVYSAVPVSGALMLIYAIPRLIGELLARGRVEARAPAELEAAREWSE